MWAATVAPATTILSGTPWFPRGNRSRRTAQAFTVSARNIRRKNIDYNNYDQEEEEEEELELPEIEDLPEAEASSARNPVEQAKVSGSAVLLALQKATAQKSIRKTKKTKKKMKMNNPREGNQNAEEDYGNVRPLCINKDWGNRLDELEKRLQHLIRI